MGDREGGPDKRSRLCGPAEKKDSRPPDKKSWFDFLFTSKRSESSDATDLYKDSAIPFPDQKDDDFWDKEYYRLAGRDGEVKLEEGIEIKKDGILTYYKVQPGDTVSGIKKKLLQPLKTNDSSKNKPLKYPQFKYLEGEGVGQGSFNVPPKLLRAGIYFPLPVPREHREVSDEKFANYCHEALQEMKVDKEYGPKIMQMIAASSEKEIITTMIAVAKLECGGEPLGRFSFHRWENHTNAFSYSYYHILYKDAGYKACQKLKLTPGKLLHPKNAGKAFLAFLIEKTQNPETLFPLYSQGREKKPEDIDRNDPSLTHFADIYNGNWRKGNPYYTLKLGIYYQKTLAFMNHEKVDYTESPKMPFVPCIGKSSKGKPNEGTLKSDFVGILQDVNYIYSMIFGKDNRPIRRSPQYTNFATSLVGAFKKFNLDLAIKPEDENGTGGDLIRIAVNSEGAPLVEFQRQTPGQKKKFSIDEKGKVVA